MLFNKNITLKFFHFTVQNITFCVLHILLGLSQLSNNLKNIFTFSAQIRDNANWYQMWNSSKENFMALSKVWNWKKRG